MDRYNGFAQLEGVPGIGSAEAWVKDIYLVNCPCPTGTIRHKGKCEEITVLPGSKTGAGGGFIQMIPTPADKPAEKFVTVDQEVDVYRAPGGNNADNTGATLKKGTQSVKLVENKAPWYHVKWPGGDGWVYSGEGYVSLNLP